MARTIVHADIKGNLIHQVFNYQQDLDPALEVANVLLPTDTWLNTVTDHINVRNDANDDWIIL